MESDFSPVTPGNKGSQINLPTDYPRSRVKDFQEASLDLALPKYLTASLKQLAHKTDSTLYMVLLACLNVLLARYSGQEELVVGSPISGRNHKDVQQIVGRFVNILALRTQIKEEQTFQEYLATVKDRTLLAYEHQDYPLEELVAEPQLERNPDRNPLFDVVFSLQDSETEELCTEKLTLKPYARENQNEQFDITITARELNGHISLTFGYATRLFKQNTIKRMGEHLVQIIKSIVKTPDLLIADIDVMSDKEKKELAEGYNNTACNFPHHMTIQQLFEEQAARTPDNIAIVCEHEKLTYKQLNDRANAFARVLKEHGVKSGDFVGIKVQRTPELLIGIMAILKAGAAYIPIETIYPPERIKYVLHNSRCKLLVSEDTFVHEYLDIEMLDIRTEEANKGDVDNPASRSVPSDIAYIIYTSGSTGVPKGVVITHRACINTLIDINRKFGVTEQDRILSISSISFDLSVYDIFGALIAGARIVLVKDPKNIQEIVSTIQREDVTIWNSVPAFMELVVASVAADYQNRALRIVLLSGDWISLKLPAKIKLHFPTASVISLGGATEGSIWSIYYPITEVKKEWKSIPYGTPLANQQMFILDKRLKLLPTGIVGEICIGGIGVAEGYANDPVKTARSFVLHPQLGKIYRTGDLGILRDEGYIEFLGRMDHQVKIRGFRIELEEIESNLLHIEGIKEAIVLDRTKDEIQYLCAYYVSDREFTLSELKAHLLKYLPDYMIPSYFIRLPHMPLTANEKVDRKGLPEPEDERSSGVEYVAPSNDIEEQLVSIWSETLKVKKIGIHDDFFELGGHSLLAMRVVARIRQVFALEMPIRLLFEHPTLAQLAQELERLQRDHEPHPLSALVPVPRTQPLPATFEQRRLWFLDRLHPNSAFYTIGWALPWPGALQVEVLERSVQELLRRHESLRTTFQEEAGQVWQIIAQDGPPSLSVVDLRALAPELQEERTRAVIRGWWKQPFDLEHGPLLRTLLVQLSETEQVLALSVHHIIFDGSSVSLFEHDLRQLYHALAVGAPSPLPALAIQYADYAVWQQQWLQEDRLQEHLAYWKERLAPAPDVLTLPTDHARPAVQRFQGALLRRTLATELTQQLKQLSREQQVTLFITLLSSFAVLLSRYSGQEVVVIGIPVANRSRVELEPVIGFLINTVPLCVDLRGNPSFEEVLQQVRQRVIEAQSHQEVPLERVVEELHLERNLSTSPIFQVVFADEGLPLLEQTSWVHDLAIEGLSLDIAKFDLSLMIQETTEGLLCGLEYSTDLFEEDTITRLAEHLQVLLQAILERPERRVLDLPLLREQERERVLSDWNDAARTTLLPTCIHELFTQQARRTPDALALVCEEQQLTYGELERRANQLGQWLQRQGVGPEVLVGLCVERSPEMVIGVLGILKAGGAYVPLDPTYPQERLAFMIQDAHLHLLLTQQYLRPLVPATELPIMSLESAWPAIGQEPAAAPVASVTPENLAYVIYTSGSTGKPKGTLVPHRGFASFAHWQRQALHLQTPQRVLQCASFSFDASVWEIVAALLSGGTLHLPTADLRMIGTDLLDVLVERAIENVIMTPSALATVPPVPLPDLRTLAVGGEACPVELMRFWAQGRAFLNAYGPTEATICASAARCEASQEHIHMGMPITNTRLYVLDQQQQPVPIGVSGELYIGGLGVTRGYLGRPELTAERFLPDPFGPQEGGRLYRTGDLVRYLPDGNLEFVGRIDQQVKIRGYRIELGEIENALGQHAAIQEAVVVVHQEGESKRLVACVVPRVSSSDLEERLRAFLLERLPTYMVPSSFVLLEHLPLTPGGKLDQHVLRAIAGQQQQAPARTYVAPRTPVEAHLAQIWQQVLGLSQPVGVQENFFALGGDSVLSLQIIFRAKELGLHFTVKHLFQHQTIAQLASVVQEHRAVEVQAQQGIVSGPSVLTPIQRWFFAQAFAQPQHWNQALLLRVPAAVTAGAWEQALGVLLRQHDGLRARFVQQEQDWQAHLVSWPLRVPLQVVEVASWPEQQHAGVVRALSQEAQASLQLGEAPLVRAVLFVGLEEQANRLLLLAHHLVIDAVSWRILLSDLARLVEQLQHGQELALSAKTSAWPTWASRLQEYARSPQVQEELAYWQEQVQETAPLPLDGTTDRNTVAGACSQEVRLSVQETQALLHMVPTAFNTQINDVLLTAVACTLGWWMGSEQVRLDLEGHGREELFADLDLSRTVGWFTTIAPLRLPVPEPSELGAGLKRIKEALRRRPQQGIGYGLLRYGQQEPLPALVQAPQAQVSFNYLGQFDQTFASSFAVASEAIGLDWDMESQRPYLLQIESQVQDGMLQMQWIHHEQIHRPETIQCLAQQCLAVLRTLIAESQRPTINGYSPSDLPASGLEQRALDHLITELRRLPIWQQQAHPRPLEDVYPQTPVQQGLWFQSRYAQGQGLYHVQLALEIAQDLHVEAFQQSWQQVMQRHPSLRTSFWELPGQEALQLVWREVPLPLSVQDWRGQSRPQQHERLQDYLREERVRGFAPQEVPQWRVLLAQTGPQEYQLVWSAHHSILDGWSMGIVLAEVSRCYRTLSQGQAMDWKPVRPYRDYLSWLQAQELGQAESYWRESLRGVEPASPLSVERRAGSPDASVAQAHAKASLLLSEQETAQLQELAQRYHLTLNTLLQGCWALLLSRYQGTDEALFGVVVSGRPAELEGVEQMVGLFINTLPLRVRVPGQLPWDEWSQQIQEQNVQLRHYEYSPLAQVQQWSGIPAGTPLFESLFAFENYPVEEEQLNALHLRLPRSEERIHYPLTIIIGHEGQHLSLNLAYETRRFEQETIERMLGHLRQLCIQIVQAPQTRLAHLSLLSEQERERVLSDWNDAARAAVPPACIHELFTQQARRTPDALALVCGEHQLTYGELERRANQLGQWLQRQGVGPEVLVGLCVERSLEMVIGVLGILKAGGAYVPLDPTYPQERLTFMIQDAHLHLLLTQQHLQTRMPAGRVPLVCLDLGWSNIAQEPGTAPVASVTPENLAYVIYTSGSTGKPKGTLVPHRGFASFAHWQRQTLHLQTSQRVLQCASFSFDASVWEMVAALLSGGTLHLPTPDLHMIGTDLLDLLVERAIENVIMTPSALATVPPVPLPDLRTLVVGGEACPVELMRFWAQGRAFLNAYGPTEATIGASAARCEASQERILIGRPVTNTRLYVLDQQQQPVPIGVPGELYIGGLGVTRGYLGRPELTAERFLPDPFGPQEGGRLYRTGDLVRYLPDGNLEFVGRIDQQVKIRGYRIELGEIEAVLAQHPQVQSCVVAVQQEGESKRLVACIVPQEPSAKLPYTLHAFLEERLPAYMVPGNLVLLERLPLTANGKLDRQALDLLLNVQVATLPASALPRTVTEALLSTIWEKVLARTPIDIHDDFFELGGHSLLAMRVVARIRQVFALEMPIRLLFEHPTLAQLAQELERLQRDHEPHPLSALVPVPRTQPLPATFEQRRLWFLDRLHPNSAFYTIGWALPWPGALQVEVLERSVQELLRRHESLRTTFQEEAGQVWQIIAQDGPPSLSVVDLRALAPELQEERTRAVIRGWWKQPFDLEHGPLLRTLLVQLSETEQVLALSVHHIIFDGPSVSLFEHDLRQLYHALAVGAPSPLPALAIQYADYAVWQQQWLQEDRLQEHLAYWKERLAPAPDVLTLPTDHARPAVQRFQGALLRRTLATELTQQLKQLSREQQVTLFITLLSSFAVLLSRYSGQEVVVIGIPVANRSRVELEPVIGFLINTVPLCVDLRGNPSFEEVLQQVRQRVIEAQSHQEVPLERVVEELHLERNLSTSPIFQVMFADEGLPLLEPMTDGLEQTSWVHDLAIEGLNAAKFDLSLMIQETTEGLLCGLEYSTDLFEEDTITRLAEHLQVLLQAILERPERRVLDLPLLREQERERVLSDWNDAARAAISSACIHELFTLQARRTPDALALVCGEQQLTYGELERRANQLGQWLQRQGVGPEVLVGLCVERSLEMVIGVLGILKAGGAYVPLDPTYPQERLAFMIQDAHLHLLLTQQYLRPLVPATELPIMSLESAWPTIVQESVTVPATSVTPENLAYVIYTSGSTGKPKGTLVPHRGFASLAYWQRQTFALQTPQRVLQCASFSFDASVWEMVVALLSGGTLHLPAPDLRMIGTDLLDVLVERAIENVTLTPSALATMPPVPLPDLQTLIVAGEACPVELMRFWAQGRAFLNAYGPTEATICASAARCEASQERILIGRPVINTRLYVLDQQQQPVPIGVSGELYIGGLGVTRGYLGRPELTAERFLPDPFGPQEGGRLYRTGDLVRYLPDGNLEFVGRIDQQVKIRGYRIELGEIENALGQHAAIQEAVVVVHQEGESKRLVACVVPRVSSSDLEERLRAFLLERLPTYMVPSSFVLLEHLPLTPGGKLDQHVLRAIAGQQQQAPARTYVAPRTPVEAHLAQIWQQVLGLSQPVGVQENFFALGGDSVLSLQIIFRAKELGLHFTVKHLFQHQTIAQLASVVQEHRAVEVQTQQGIVSGPSVLTPIQHWFFAQAFAQPQHWNQALLLRVPAAVTAGAWEQALGVLLRQHDGLRARFVQQEQDWQAHLVSWPLRVPLQVVEVTSWPEQQHAGVVRALSQEAQASLQLGEAPLVRAVLFVGLEEQANRLLLLAHHLVIDAVSWRILLSDLARLVEQLQHGQELALSAKTSAWPTWASRLQEYARSPQVQEELAYWQEQVQETAPLPLDGTTDRNTVAGACSQEVRLSVQETQALLHMVPTAFNTQINDVLLTAVACTLGWWMGSEQVRLDLEGHGREELFADLDLSRTVGWFTTIAPLRLPVPEPSELGAGLKRIKEALRRRPQQGIGYGLLRYGQQEPLPALVQAPQAQVSFNYLGQFDQTFASSFAVASEAIGLDWDMESQRPYLLQIESQVQDGMLQMQWIHHEQIHRPETIQCLAQQCLAVLRALIAESQRPDLNGYSPSDLPASGLEQRALDHLITELRRLPIWQQQAHPRPLEDVYPQTPVQQGLWFQSRYAQGQGLYHVQLALEIAQDLHVEAFQQSWQQVMQRHPSLRTSFWELPGQEALQLVWREVPLPLSVQDWRGQSRPQQHERLQDYLREERVRGFAPQEVPQWRVLLAQTGPQEYQLVWSAHHSILDGWSMGIVLAEVSRCYRTLSQGQAMDWKPVRPYRDYLSWLQAQELGQAESYWRESLRGVEPASPLSVERRAGSPDASVAQTHAKASLLLSEQETAQLQELAQRYHLTLNTLLQGCWALLLSRYQGTDEALFGVVVSGRPEELEGVEQMVGLFINTLPLRVRVPGQLPWDEWSQQIQEQNVQLRHYEYSPLAQVQQWSGIPAGTPLFESLFVFENYPVEEEQFAALHLRASRGEERVHYPLGVKVGFEDQRLSLNILYETRRFEQETIERMLGHLRQLCAQIVQAPQTRLAHLSLLADQEREQVLSDWNDVARTAISSACIHELFTQQARRTPDALALVCGEQQLTYGELERRANQLGQWLQRQGVGPEVLVGLCVERSPEMVIGVLGILKAGGAYVPLDPTYPQERLAFMIQDAHLHLLLTQQHLQARVPAGRVPLVCLDLGWFDLAQEPVTAPVVSVTPENLAYVIYTSGSTGKPKGTLVPHRGFASLAYWQRQALHLQTSQRVLQCASFSFDASVWEMVAALLSGGTLHLPASDLHMIGMDLFGLLVERGIENMTLTPSALATMPPVPLPDLRTLVVAGEACPVELMRFWAQGRAFLNAYGPTEATICACAARCEASQERILIGQPLTNTRLYVLDQQQQPVPIGVPGELYIGGLGVTRGYLRRPELTAERFLPDPFGPQEGGRLYRTGDLVRSLPDGNLEFVGRIDQQVKIRGYRIELGEIEAVLAQHPQVQSCVVAAQEPSSGGKQLVAYVVPKPSTLPDRHELMGLVQEQLPAYMVPKSVVLLESLPLTPNGKVDHRALLAPMATYLTSEREYVAPETEIARIVADIWSSFLDGARVGMLDNFFELGGHSLTATRVISSIRQELQIDISLQSLFETPILAEFSQRIENISAFLKSSQDIDEELTDRETGVL